MSNITDIRTLISQLRLLTRAQVQIMHLVKDKAKKKDLEECKESDFDDTIQMRFVAGGRIPLQTVNEEDCILPPKEYDDIIAEVRSKIEPLQDLLKGRINDICSKKALDINNVEEIELFAKWIEISEDDFCQFRAEKDAPGAIEFLEKWTLYFKRKDKERVENAIAAIQDIINRYTLTQRSELSLAIKAMTDACPV